MRHVPSPHVVLGQHGRKLLVSKRTSKEPQAIAATKNHTLNFPLLYMLTSNSNNPFLPKVFLSLGKGWQGGSMLTLYSCATQDLLSSPVNLKPLVGSTWRLLCFRNEQNCTVLIWIALNISCNKSDRWVYSQKDEVFLDLPHLNSIKGSNKPFYHVNYEVPQQKVTFLPIVSCETNDMHY